MILILSGAYTWYFKDIAHHAAQPLESMMNLCKGANKHET